MLPDWLQWMSVCYDTGSSVAIPLFVTMQAVPDCCVWLGYSLWQRMVAEIDTEVLMQAGILSLWGEVIIESPRSVPDSTQTSGV